MVGDSKLPIVDVFGQSKYKFNIHSLTGFYVLSQEFAPGHDWNIILFENFLLFEKD